jgi:hypothetical protein
MRDVEHLQPPRGFATASSQSQLLGPFCTLASVYFRTSSL